MNSLFPQTEFDQKVDALKCDPAKKTFILARLRMAEQATNCNFKALNFDRKKDYLKVIAAQNHCSVRTVERCAQVLRNGDDLEQLACDRPGPKRGEFKSLDADVRAHLLGCFLPPKNLNCRQSHRSVVRYLQTKQNSPGCQVSHFYEIPSYSMVKRYWREVLIPMYGPQREGREAVKSAAGYIDRLYDDEFAGDTWCLDEWEIDGAFYDEQNHRRVFNYGAGRPIVHILTILDERTTCIIDHLVTWEISLEDGVFALAERVIRQHFLPKRMVSDRAGRFRALVRGHMVVGSDDELVKKLAGPLGELGVIPRGSEEKNPRANRLERLHRLYADRAREFGPSWKPPLQKHEHREIDDAVDRHLNAYCRYGTIGPQLMSIQEAERRIAQWVEGINLADTEAKGCNGLTRVAAFRQFQPSADEIAQRKPNQAALDLAFAEKDERAIREGGIIELEDGARYSCPQLIEWRLRLDSGVKVPVMRYRRDPLHLIVSPPGAEPFIAERRAMVGTKDEALLSDEIEKLAHVRKMLGGETAERDREMEEHLRSLQNNMRGLRARPMTIERMPTSAEAARQIWGLKG